MKNNYVLPLYPNSQDVPLPSMSYKIRVHDAYGKALFDYLNKGEYFIYNITNDDYSFDLSKYDYQTIAKSHISPVGVVCTIEKITKNKASYTIDFKAVEPCRVLSSRKMEEQDVILANAESIEQTPSDQFMLMPFIFDVRNRYNSLKKTIPNLPDFPSDEEITASEPSYYLATFLNLPKKYKVSMLNEPSARKRLQIVYEGLNEFNLDPKIEEKLNRKVEMAMSRNQTEFILRAKMQAIKEELKPFDGPTDEDKYKKVIDDKEGVYPEKVKARVKSEWGRLQTMPGASQEAAVIKSYLDLLISLPWTKATQDNENMAEVKKVLDEDHYGLKKQKDRISEYLAVKSLTHSLKSPILCLYGPPGTGKTSLAISIAKALGRKFCKVSLGGVSDESEIRGHRKTYVGAMPGKIISNIEKVGVNNPVMLLDEIDKLQRGGYHGDPAAALLEVLDPEQNVMFQDNYLEETFDLSNVLFICTANNLRDIPAPLMDRLELIELNTYTTIEKYHIAVEHLIPLELETNGLTKDNISFSDEAIYYIIENYTREAGVRSLRREIGAIMRKFAVEFLTEGSTKEKAHIDVGIPEVEKYLGKPIYVHTKSAKAPQVGVVNGLAYTDFGGEILPIEVNYYGGSGQLLLTGNLGKVMEESARTAFSYVKSISSELGISDDFWKTHDFHIHAPEGAVPKDGPSAGVALTIAVISAATNIALKNDVGMTGEVDLRGNSMPIGGLREKSLAALREHLSLILVPKENHNDVIELPQEVKDGLKIIEVSSVKEVIPHIFVKDPFVQISHNEDAKLNQVPVC